MFSKKTTLIAITSLAFIFCSCGPKSKRTNNKTNKGNPPKNQRVWQSNSVDDAASMTGNWLQINLFCYNQKEQRITAEVDISQEGVHVLRALDPTFQPDDPRETPYVEFRTTEEEGRLAVENNLIHHSIFYFAETRLGRDSQHIKTTRVIENTKPNPLATHFTSVSIEKSNRALPPNSNQNSIFASIERSTDLMDLRFYVEFRPGERKILNIITADQLNLCSGEQHTLSRYRAFAEKNAR